ncbi:hypothetical protein [Okeania sp. KiyG1]|uniref:hypothetical protein n=1 Tax=Okeania sp. KiyG1 TaxID=2720165 RepID=UPI00192438C0|nr:hypothetical protein [Okeania sp. KiyG1]GFZ93931.1 hypothetical protein CYANOKiyG1_04540 [Okeania sp. KiyG1]
MLVGWVEDAPLAQLIRRINPTQIIPFHGSQKSKIKSKILSAQNLIKMVQEFIGLNQLNPTYIILYGINSISCFIPFGNAKDDLGKLTKA